MAEGNVWLQVKKGNEWENLYSIPQRMIGQYTASLSARFGETNVRVSPEAKRQLVAECCCRDVNGETMALCPRHTREWARRERELKATIAEELQKAATSPAPRGAVLALVQRLRRKP